MSAVRVMVPASTANLGPGFDCLGMALKLYNIVEMQEATKLEITVEGEGTTSIARDDSNLVCRAAAMLFERAGYRPGGLQIHLINNIPLARGLGSSSAAILGGLLAANALCGHPFAKQELLDMALKLEGHADNLAAALYGGIAIVAPVDGRVRHVKLYPPAGLKVIAAVPDYTLSTAASRKVLPETIPYRDAVYNLGRLALLVAALSRQDTELFSVAMQDALHQPYRSTLIPGMPAAMQAAQDAGALSVTLSGAGPTITAFACTREKEIARTMQQSLSDSGISGRVLILEPDSEGAKLKEQ
ncbi:MAG: homoserine kinase [Bacillota bacterium]|uniref:homoserine kinase n=1 Tax=Desulfurispora thermophila TaxID=265470 RepID=UPI000360047F|nr:homoserine kinase [Desulfurispora thermophila]